MSILSFSFLADLAAIVAGGCFGTLFRGRMRLNLQQVTLRACGLVVLAAGAFGVMYSFFPFSEDHVETVGWLLILAALLVGGILGSSMDVEGLFDRAASALIEFSRDPQSGKSAHADSAAKKGHSLDNVIKLPVYNLPSARSGHRFADGFAIGTIWLVTSSLTLNGIIEAGGDPALLYWKALLDFVVIAALASVYGMGVTVSALSFVLTVALIDLLGGIWDASGNGLVNHYDSLIDKYSGSSKAKNLIKELPDEIDTLFTEAGEKIASQNAVIAGVISLVLGLDLAAERRFKAANLLPAVLIPIVYYGVIVLVKIIEGIVLSVQAANAAVILAFF